MLLGRKDLSPVLQLSVRFRPSSLCCVCSSVLCAFLPHSSATSTNKTVLKVELSFSILDECFKLIASKPVTTVHYQFFK